MKFVGTVNPFRMQLYLFRCRHICLWCIKSDFLFVVFIMLFSTLLHTMTWNQPLKALGSRISCKFCKLLDRKFCKLSRILVGKYTSPMDPMALCVAFVWLFEPADFHFRFCLPGFHWAWILSDILAKMALFFWICSCEPLRWTAIYMI